MSLQFDRKSNRTSLLDDDFDITINDLEKVFILNIIQNSNYINRDLVNISNIVYDHNSISDIPKNHLKHYVLYVKINPLSDYIQFIFEWHWYPHYDMGSSLVTICGEPINLKYYLKH